MANYQKSLTSPSYIGRFAPSPSGPLHLGSLVTAVASFLQAKKHQGKWCLRIDDIDPPREMPNATATITQALLAHGLEWDGEFVMQSSHYPDYEKALTFLKKNHRCYYCRCTRKQIKQNGPYYCGTCRDKDLAAEGCSLRFKNDSTLQRFDDVHLGTVQINPLATAEDFIIKRKDNLYAYHLASVVDDIKMGITEIVRGADLLSPSACQVALFQALNGTIPRFVHIPVIASRPGKKLSKQNHARALDNKQASGNLLQALSLLNMPVEESLQHAKPLEILHWATEHWQLSAIPRLQERVISGLE